MDIGTAKPSRAIQERIPHRMIDVAEPSEDISAKAFQDLGVAAIADALESHGRVVIVGGSGLHFRALVDPMTFYPTDPVIRSGLEGMAPEELRRMLVDVDPHAGSHVDLDNPRRVVRALEIHTLTGVTPSVRATTPEASALRNYEPRIPFVGFGLDAGEGQKGRVADRFTAMLDDGLLTEVEELSQRLGTTAAQAVGYKQLLDVVRGHVDLPTAIDTAIGATNGLVKRQRTFFGRDPRITWLPWQDDGEQRVAASVASIKEVAQWTS